MIEALNIGRHGTRKYTWSILTSGSDSSNIDNVFGSFISPLKRQERAIKGRILGILYIDKYCSKIAILTATAFRIFSILFSAYRKGLGAILTPIPNLYYPLFINKYI